MTVKEEGKEKVPERQGQDGKEREGVGESRAVYVAEAVVAETDWHTEELGTDCGNITRNQRIIIKLQGHRCAGNSKTTLISFRKSQREGIQANKFLGSPCGQRGGSAVHTNSRCDARRPAGEAKSTLRVWLLGSAVRVPRCLPRAPRPIDGLEMRL
ncbi:hypothetical protein GWK47_034546 [Chionoecetes opilio]|uniref:Uncharacterized protein n=1 Tax=Chionoecetes opilio TaxID=41210 RepID=A0A8J4YHK4_CHIOP|nr:hypothetical protein GWK47_034546 [Chionoecetes opilio]